MLKKGISSNLSFSSQQLAINMFAKTAVFISAVTTASAAVTHHASGGIIHPVPVHPVAVRPVIAHPVVSRPVIAHPAPVVVHRAPVVHPVPVHPAPTYGHPAPTYAEPAKPYAFEYGVHDEYSGTSFGQQENSDAASVVGSYRVALPDGRTQIVDYHADAAGYGGYVADVKYEGVPQYGPAPHPAPPVHPAPVHPAPAHPIHG